MNGHHADFPAISFFDREYLTHTEDKAVPVSKQTEPANSILIPLRQHHKSYDYPIFNATLKQVSFLIGEIEE